MTSAPAGRRFEQMSLDELDEPLRDTTFVVVDLETTGGRAGNDAITEIGAVKVRGGEVIGEFQTLVDPGVGDHSVRQRAHRDHRRDGGCGAPRSRQYSRLSSSSPAAACLSRTTRRSTSGFFGWPASERGPRWPGFAVVDTAVLARRVLTRDEVPNCRLATLATFFRAAHPADTSRAGRRARHGRRAARADRRGWATSASSLCPSCARSPPGQRRAAPQAAPGRPPADRSRGLRVPGRAGRRRSTSGRAATCAPASASTSWPARRAAGSARWSGWPSGSTRSSAPTASRPQVRELRLIAAHKPRYNRRSKFPERVGLAEAHRRGVSPAVHGARRSAPTARPISARCAPSRQAEAVRDAIHDAVPLRQCTRPAVACAARCGPPARSPASAAARRPARARQSPEEYAALAELVRAAWSGDVRPLVDPLRAPLAALSAAAALRAGRGRPGPDRHGGAGLRADAAARIARAPIAELVAARPTATAAGSCLSSGTDGWRRPGVAERGVPWPVIDALRATADVGCPTPDLARCRPPWPRRPSASCAGSRRRARDCVDLRAVDVSGLRRRTVARLPGSRPPPARPPNRSPTAVGCDRRPGPPAPPPRPRTWRHPRSRTAERPGREH